jgi:YfiH family protein
MGGPESTTAEFVARRARFLRAAGIHRTHPVLLRQVHGAAVVPCPRPDETIEADGILLRDSDGEDVAPSIRTADCVPVLVADRRGRAAAVVHAGWRGTAAGITIVALQHLAEAGVEPGNTVVALGPSIGQCCYEVGRDVVEAVASASGGEASAMTVTRGGGIYLDLHEALGLQLTGTGIPAASIHRAPWCTSCRGDLFYSYRREGAAAGRQMASIAFKGASP